MPFRDQEWEDLQRDYDIFPAYSDYIYGPDERLIVTQEPGLHPTIYPIGVSAPIRYTNSIPSRSWSYKTAEGLEKSKNAAAQMLLTGQGWFSNSDMSGTDSGSSTPGLDVRSQTGSPLGPQLPPQGVRTVSEKEMARRKALNASERRSRSRPVVPFTPSQQQQPVRLAGQQTQTKNTQIVHKPRDMPQQPSLLRLSSTTDIDENLPHMASHQKPGMLPPFASLAPTLPPSANLLQQQLQHATALTNNSPLLTAPNASSKPNQKIPPLQPNDILNNPRYDYLYPDERMQIAKTLADRWVVVRESPTNSGLRTKALLDIRNVSIMVHKSVPSLQAGTDLQRQRTQQLQTQAALEAQTRHMHQTQQCQHMPQAPQVYAQPQPQPGVSFSQPTQSSPTQPSQQPAPQELYYSIPQASQHMQLPQQATSPGYQAHYQLQQQIQEGYHQSPVQQSNHRPTQSQVYAELRANINCHIPQVWQYLLIARNTSQPAQYRENVNQWIVQFKNSLPVEGRAYLMQVIQRAFLEQSQGRDALAFLELQGRST